MIVFKIGDEVRTAFGFADRSGLGVYTVLRVLPERVDGEREYRIKGDDGFERVVASSQLRPIGASATGLDAPIQRDPTGGL